MVETGEFSPGVISTSEVGVTGLHEKEEEKPSLPKKEVKSSEPREDLDRERKVIKPSIDDLFQAKNIEALLKRKDDPQAQLAAIVLISNAYRNINIKSEMFREQMESVDIEAISSSLDLVTESSELVEAKRQQLLETHRRFWAASRESGKLLSSIMYSDGDRKPQLKKQLKAVDVKKGESEAEMDRLYRELTLPIRRAILFSEKLPEEYKLSVIEGIKGHKSVFEMEDQLMKEAYVSTKSEAIKKQIADTVMFNIGYDLNSFDVVPIIDLKELGVDMDEFFIATLGNPDTTAEFIKTRVAPVFFPEEDPTRIKKCWETLKKVTGVEGNFSEASFGSAEGNHYTKLMNIEYFRNFVENSDDLIPVVEMLSSYGFTYIPGEEGKLYPQYVERLKDLGSDLQALKKDLEAIKAVIPDFKYQYVVDSRNLPTKSERELYVEDNPFAIALKQNIHSFEISSDVKLDKDIELFNQLYQIVPEKWKGGFLQTYIEKMSEKARYFNNHSTITKKAITEASKYVFDSSLTFEQIEIFATDFFESSLDPQNENIKMAMDFCEKYADKIRVCLDGEKRVDANATWYQFSLLAADLYRYSFVFGEEEAAIAKMKRDLIYARGAVARIKDPDLRDRAVLNLVYALVDEEVGDLQSAELFVDMINDGVIKKEAQKEIEIEVERSEKGETTTWKKMEKIRRESAYNLRFLKDIFGYGSQEGLREALDEHYKIFKTSLDLYATFSPENQANLEKEVQRIRTDFTVTVNMTWTNMLKSLERGRLISIWENPEVMELRNEDREYNYEQQRNKVERMVGNRSKGGMKDPHPIYGAAAGFNGRDEYYGGTGGGYGECFFVLKTDEINDRTSFCYDDSFGDYNRWLVGWEESVVVKAIHNLNDSQSRHGYVEAQILGGVNLEDIESINIPSDAIYGKNKYGWSESTDVLEKIDELRKKYPGIKINIINGPK